MNESPTNAIVQIGGKLFGPVGKIISLGSKLERLVDRVNALREDQIKLQLLTSEIYNRSLSNSSMIVDSRQRNQDRQTHIDMSLLELKRENAILRKENADLEKLVTELKHKIDIDAKDKLLELLSSELIKLQTEVNQKNHN